MLQQVPLRLSQHSNGICSHLRHIILLLPSSAPLPQQMAPPQQMWNSWISPHLSPHCISPFPFTLKLLTERIRICQGCRIPFHPHSDIPPYNLVVFRKECRPYKGQDGVVKTPSVPSNAHYHVTMPCIRAAEPSFVPGQLVIPPNVHVKLSPAHKEYIFFSLGINI